MIVIQILFCVWVGFALISGLINPETRLISAAIAALVVAAASGMYL